MGSSTEATVAWTGSEWGIAWTDDRPGYSDIYFTRLDAGGDEVGFDLRLTRSAFAWASRPTLVWNGNEFGLTWQSLPDWGAGRGGSRGVALARLSATGDVIAAVRPGGDPGSDELFLPHVTWAGEWWVSYELWRGGGPLRVKVARHDPALAYLAHYDVAESSGTSRLAVSNGVTGIVWQEQFAPLAADRRPVRAANVGVGWTALVGYDAGFAILAGDGAGGIELRRVDRYGTALAGPDAAIAAGPGATRGTLAWTGSEFGVAWRDTRDSAAGDIYFARVAQSGCP